MKWKPDLDNIIHSSEFWITVYELGDIDEVTLIDAMLDNLLTLGPLLDKYERPANVPGVRSEPPGFQCPFPVPLTARIIHGRWIKCVTNSPLFVRDYPYYWDRTGSRPVKWEFYNAKKQLQRWTFYHLYVGLTPKNLSYGFNEN